MKRLLIVVAVLLFVGQVCLAQPEYSDVEFQGFYQRIQGFDFQSGSAFFEFEDEGFNGGGFGINYNVSHWLGIFSQTSFLAGVEQSGIKLRFINQTQGAKVTKRGLIGESVNVFAKGGIGFVRHVFDISGQQSVNYGTSFTAGGGTEIKLQEGLWLLLDLSRVSIGLPNITNLPGRDKWDSSWAITTGVSFQF